MMKYPDEKRISPNLTGNFPIKGMTDVHRTGHGLQLYNKR